MFVGTLIFLVVVIIFTALFIIIRNALSKAMSPKDVELGTSILEFRESNAVSNHIASGDTSWMDGNIARQYETMCVLEPERYKGYVKIDEIIKSYFDIINGNVIDISGCNTPSENLLDKPNPHYALYLENQIRAMENHPDFSVPESFRAELLRVKSNEEGQILRTQFIAHLINNGVDPMVATHGVTDGKLDSFNEKDWETYIRRAKAYEAEAGSLIAISFVSLFDDKNIVLNMASFQKFVIYKKYEVPAVIIEQIIKGTVSEEQATRIVSLVQERSYTWSEATQEVLESDLNDLNISKLREKYGFII